MAGFGELLAPLNIKIPNRSNMGRRDFVRHGQLLVVLPFPLGGLVNAMLASKMLS